MLESICSKSHFYKSCIFPLQLQCYYISSLNKQKKLKPWEKRQNQKTGATHCSPSLSGEWNIPQPCCHQGDSQGLNLKEGGNWKTPRYWENDFCSILQAIAVHVFRIFFFSSLTGRDNKMNCRNNCLLCCLAIAFLFQPQYCNSQLNQKGIISTLGTVRK